MTLGYGTFRTGVSDGSLPVAAKVPGQVNGGNPAVYVESFDLSKANVNKANGTSNFLATKPEGHVVLGIEVVSSVGLAAATLAFGIASAPAKYGAAAAYGANADTRKTWDVTTAEDDISTGPEDIIMTIGAADLPAAGIVVARMYTAARG